MHIVLDRTPITNLHNELIYFVHLVLQLLGILIVHPVLFPQLLHHGRRLLVALLCRLLLFNPVFVADVLTHL